MDNEIVGINQNSVQNIIKTPDLLHIKKCDWENVYEPAEDSFLLLDSLEKDLDFIKFMKPLSIVEVGSGCGIIITALNQVFSTGCHCLAIDINPYACKLTLSTSQHNHTSVDVIQGDLTSSLREFTIDMIVFNPPYVVTENSEITSGSLLTKSWAGGNDGTIIIKKFLNEFGRVMRHKSFGYILLLKENKPDDIMKILKDKSFTCSVIASRKMRGEELFVVKFFKNIDL